MLYSMPYVSYQTISMMLLRLKALAQMTIDRMDVRCISAFGLLHAFQETHMIMRIKNFRLLAEVLETAF